MRLDPKKGFFLQESAARRKPRRRVGLRVTYRNELGDCAGYQRRKPDCERSVLQPWCDIGRSRRHQTRYRVCVIGTGGPRGAVILLRKRHLAVMMASLFCKGSTMLWTRPKRAERRTAEGKEPSGIENRDNRDRYSTSG